MDYLQINLLGLSEFTIMVVRRQELDATNIIIVFHAIFHFVAMMIGIRG